MAAYELVVLSNAAQDVDDATVAQWYDGRHIPQVRAAVPGVGEVRRLRLALPGSDGAPTSQHRYLTSYEVEADGPQDVLAALGAGLADGRIEPGTVLDPASMVVVVYEAAASNSAR
ncbi:MAG TPA: hypothetical protein VI248_02760 [Kineosporiaceae bacterium]